MTAAATDCLRKGRPRDQRIDDQIASAALEVLADVGFDRFSVEEVAQRAGVAKTTVYRRYPTRADLITVALAQLDDDVPDMSACRCVRERLAAILSAIRAGTPHSPRGRVLMHAVGSNDPLLARQVHDRVLAGRASLLRSVIAEGVASGELRSDLDVNAAVAVLVGPMLYLGMWRGREDARRVSVGAVVDLIMGGLTPATDS